LHSFAVGGAIRSAAAMLANASGAAARLPIRQVERVATTIRPCRSRPWARTEAKATDQSATAAFVAFVTLMTSNAWLKHFRL
jgi:hypothetical protein